MEGRLIGGVGMIEHQVEIPVSPGEDKERLPLVGEAGHRQGTLPGPIQAPPGTGPELYILPGGLVDIALNELGGQVTSVELLPEEHD